MRALLLQLCRLWEPFHLLFCFPALSAADDTVLAFSAPFPPLMVRKVVDLLAGRDPWCISISDLPDRQMMEGTDHQRKG